MSTPITITGEQRSISEEFTIASWTGELLPEVFDSFDAASKKVEAMQAEAKKLGFAASSSRLKILRREVREIVGGWIG